MKEQITKIANQDVPIHSGDVITLHFSAGRLGTEEAGVYQFWTIFNDKYSYAVRQRAGDDPGERFRRMEGDPLYEQHWKIATTAKGIRPATQDEVDGWLDGHQDDAEFVEIKRD